MADRVHRALGMSATLVVVAGLVGWRSLRGGFATSTAAPIPTVGITNLLPYASPVADSARLVTAVPTLVAPSRDPFAAQAVTRGPEARPSDGRPPPAHVRRPAPAFTPAEYARAHALVGLAQVAGKRNTAA